MQNDPTTYVLASGMLCGCLGFFTACLFTAKTVRRANLEGWKEGVRFYQQRQTESQETPRL